MLSYDMIGYYPHMKKRIIAFILLFLSIAPVSYAQTSTLSATVENSYQLAYPGMLPDNPLYKLKVLRDKIVLYLIKDPKKQVEQFLLQADKGIAMVPLLVEKGKIDLAKETAFKAEHNFTELTFVFKKTETKPDAKAYKKLTQAALKHQEVLTAALKKVNKEDQKALQQVINFSKTNQEELGRILTKKD